MAITKIAFLVIWILMALIFLIVELFTLDLVSIWFTFGATSALIANISGIEYYWQILIFTITSLVTAIFFIVFVVKNKTLNRKKYTNIEALINQEIIIINLLNDSQTKGETKLEGKIWTVIEQNNHVLKINEKYQIVKIEGTKLIAKAKEH